MTGQSWEAPESARLQGLGSSSSLASLRVMCTKTEPTWPQVVEESGKKWAEDIFSIKLRLQNSGGDMSWFLTSLWH